MKLLTRRILILILCVALPCGALAQSVAPEDPVTHAVFTLSTQIHADGFPPVEAHLKDWEAFLSKLTLTGDLFGTRFLQPDSRVKMEGALNINGDESIPFVYDEYSVYRYVVSPALRNDAVMFNMNVIFEFMLKPFFYLGLPTNYIALLLYPNAAWYLADRYYSPIRDMFDAARTLALDEEADTVSGEITYTVSYEELLQLCATFNAIALEDEVYKRLQRFLDVLLADLYLSEFVLEAMSHFELMLAVADPEREGMKVIESPSGMTCILGGHTIFQKNDVVDGTEIAFALPVPDDYLLSVSYRSQTHGETTDIFVSAAVTQGEDTRLSLSITGDGLPAEGALAGEGTVRFSLDGLELYDVPPPQTFQFAWSRTGTELPYDLSLSLDWLHPETGLPAASVYFEGSLENGDQSALTNTNYSAENFFGLNSVSLNEYKRSWGPSILAYMLPVALEMPIGVIDDVVNFLLDSDILISIAE